MERRELLTAITVSGLAGAFLLAVADNQISPTAGQEEPSTQTRSGTGQYFVIIFKRGPQWIAGKSVWEQRLRKHGEYMQKLFENKKLLFAGPFLDDQGGLAVVDVSSEDEAKNILAEEPATQEHIFEAELHAIRFTFDAGKGRVAVHAERI